MSSILSSVPEMFQALRTNVGKGIVGYDHIIRRMFEALLTGGHVLTTSPPGLAKTTLTAMLQRSFRGSKFKRLQFTPDTMPSQIKGFKLFDESDKQYKVHHGLMYGANFVLADEINRAPATTQAPLLEAMQEGIVTIDGNIYPLERPLVVMATQNPVEQEGTFRLPEAQQDRFMFSLWMTYLERELELKIARLIERYGRNLPEAMGVEEVIGLNDLIDASKALREPGNIIVPEVVLGYAIDLCRATRPRTAEFSAFAKSQPNQKLPFSKLVALGASPRSYSNLVLAGQAAAAIEGSKEVTHRHIKLAAHDVLRHRIMRTATGENKGWDTDELVEVLLKTVPTHGIGNLKDKIAKEDEAAIAATERKRTWYEADYSNPKA